MMYVYAYLGPITGTCIYVMGVRMATYHGYVYTMYTAVWCCGHIRRAADAPAGGLVLIYNTRACAMGDGGRRACLCVYYTYMHVCTHTHTT